MAGNNKKSDAEIEVIVNQICLLMIKGITRRGEILQYIARMDALDKEEMEERRWFKVGLSVRQIDEYIKRANEIFSDYNKQTRDATRALYIARFEELFKMAVSAGKLQTANNIMKNMLYLQGMGGVNIGNFNIKTFDVVLTPEQEKAYQDRTKAMLKQNVDLTMLGIDIKDL